MSFHKRFPKDVPGSRYPEWIDVELSDEEESRVEQVAREEHVRLLKDCLADAQQVASETGFSEEGDVVRLAAELFEKRASHVVWHKEEAARLKFERENP